MVYSQWLHKIKNMDHEVGPRELQDLKAKIKQETDMNKPQKADLLIYIEHNFNLQTKML